MPATRAAVIGVGYLGRFHAQKYALQNDAELIAVVDIRPERAALIAAELGVEAATHHREILSRVDAVSVVVPAEQHFAVTKDCLEHGLHVLVEKPFTETIAQADALIELAEQNRCVLQVGHLERFNPVVEEMRKHITSPLFVEAHRLSVMSNRGTEVDVVLDLMIHDLDIVLDIVAEEIVDIRATGLRVLTDEIDIANARLEFASGCTANITASRVSKGPMRKMRVFQRDTYLSVDFQSRQVDVSRKDPVALTELGYPVIHSDSKQLQEADALHCEVAAFLAAVRQGQPPMVSGLDGRRALETAQRITGCMRVAG